VQIVRGVVILVRFQSRRYRPERDVRLNLGGGRAMKFTRALIRSRPSSRGRAWYRCAPVLEKRLRTEVTELLDPCAVMLRWTHRSSLAVIAASAGTGGTGSRRPRFFSGSLSRSPIIAAPGNHPKPLAIVTRSHISTPQTKAQALLRVMYS